MKRGLIATLALVAIIFTCADASFARAPRIRDIPDITIGDSEDNIGTDNNWFVFTNAFKFVDYVEDADTTLSDLLWSFDEGDDPAPVDLTPWFNINDVGAVHVGSAAMAANDSPTPASNHVLPSGSEDISTGSNGWATFRDIVFSPTTTPPFASPSPALAAEHATGKMVRFYVSDSTNVATRDIWVNTVDTGWDSASGGTPFVVYDYERFWEDVTSPTPGDMTGWTPLTTDPNAVTDYDSGNTALRVTVATSADPRVNGYVTGNSEWMPYASAIGTGNVVRAKFWVFATGQASSTDLNQLPNMRARVANRFAYTVYLEVFNHLISDPAGTALGVDVRPSNDPNNPSLYRVDFDPVDVPRLSVAGEGCLRGFEAYCLEPQENGALELSESLIGSYPWSEMPDSPADPKVKYYKTFTTSASDAGDLAITNTLTELVIGKRELLAAQAWGPDVALDGSTDPTYSESAAGITLDTTLVATNRFGSIAREISETGAETERIRVEAGKQYRMRWHLTSDTNANNQPMFRVRGRSLKFMWSYKAEIGGAWGAGNSNNLLAQELLPGVGSQNPSGYYNLILHTPISADIQASQPTITAFPGPGETGFSRKDVLYGLDVLDSMSANANYITESGRMTCDELVVWVYDLVSD
jgi:hypothetical protein